MIENMTAMVIPKKRHILVTITMITPKEVWEETYEKRTEEDRNVIEITLSAPGTLESALAALDKPIYALRIIGEMNQDDYYIINQIEQISFVDLSQTTNTSIPTNFLNNKEQLVAIMLPETLKENSK